MKKLFFIIIVTLIGSVVVAQQSCLPVYNLPVKTIRLSSGKLAYVEKGKGQTLLFIHGLGGNISHWLKEVNGLSSTYRCIAIDLPGYGWSDKQVDTKGIDQLQFYADAVSEFLYKKKIRNVVLAGHSMGGQVAIITSLQNKKIKKLVLVAPAGFETFTDKESQLLIASTPPSVYEKQDEAVIRNNFKINFFQQPADAEQLIMERLKFKTCNDFKLYSETVSNGIKGMLAHPVKDSLQNLSMPVLVIFGANDGLIPNKYLHPLMNTVDLAKQSAALIRKSSTEIIQNAGHMVQFEKSNEMISILKNFIQ